VTAQGFHYAAQMYSVILPDIDWATTPLAARNDLSEEAESMFLTAYGKYRRRRSLAEKTDNVCAEACEWEHGHDDYEKPCCH
jgi:hypothetical protein